MTSKPSPTTSPTRVFVNVQGLRAIAAIAVFGLHLNFIEPRFTGAAFLGGFTPLGSWGVDLFFVISGFVMVTSTWNDFAEPGISGRFFLRRLLRIYPPYFILLIPVTLLYIVAPHMVNGEQAIKPSILASYLMLPQQGYGLLIVGWTLVYEMFFYVIFALVLAMDRRYCLPFMAAWGILTLALSAFLYAGPNIYLHTYTDPLLIEFIFGVFIGYCAVHRGVPFVIPCLIAGVAGIVAADVFYTAFNAAHELGDYFRFILIGGPMALFFIGVLGLETRYELTFPAWLIVIGNASYSLYLWHIPLAVFIGRLSAGHQALLHRPVMHAAWLIFTAAFVIGASIAIFYWVERPLLRFFHAHFTKRTISVSEVPPMVARSFET